MTRTDVNIHMDCIVVVQEDISTYLDMAKLSRYSSYSSFLRQSSSEFQYLLYS